MIVEFFYQNFYLYIIIIKMSREINYYRVRCTTDNTDEYVWSTTTPTVCPTNGSHTINSSLTTILDTISDNNVVIKEELTPENSQATQGTYKFHGYSVNVPQSGNASTTLSFPFPITLMNGWFFSKDNQVGDVVHCMIPNTIVGIIVAPVTANATVLTVNSTVTDNVIPGYFLDLLDTQTFTINDLGMVTNVDTANSQVTVSTPATDTFTDIGNVVVRMTVKIIENMKISSGGQKFDFASKKIGGKYVPANTGIGIEYCNLEGNAKVFDFNMEYLY